MIERATVADRKTAMGTGHARVIGVREFSEFQSGHVSGAVHIPRRRIPVRRGVIPTDGSVYVIRESESMSWLLAAFRPQHDSTVVDVKAGTGTWRIAGHPLNTAVAA